MVDGVISVIDGRVAAPDGVISVIDGRVAAPNVGFTVPWSVRLPAPQIHGSGSGLDKDIRRKNPIN
jgi:hypothetical protein